MHAVRERVSNLMLCAFAAVAVTACATLPQSGARSPTLAHVPVVALPDGHEAVLVRSHGDEWKLADGTRRVSVEYLWDYTAAVARVRTVGGDGVVLDDEPRPGLTLNATDEEMAWAYEIARADPRIASRLTPDVVYYGGFSFREPGHPDCDRASRCVHVIASRDEGRYKVFHAMVDLQAARVVDPDFDPAMGGLNEPRKNPE